MKKISVITGTRAEYGLLMPLLKKIKASDNLELQIIATGSHLSPEFGMTYQFIERDGFEIDEKVEILLSSDTPVGISKSMGLAMISFGDVFQRLKPDMIVLLGDRFEAFAIAAAATVARIPIAHLHGGETTEGAMDESFRHAITKMSYLHFTSTEEYRNRVIQLGEHPSRVFNVGAIGIENILTLPLLSNRNLEESLGIPIKSQLFLVTFHPVTLEQSTSKQQFLELLSALDEYEDTTIIFTKANADTDGRIINQMIDDYIEKHPGTAFAFSSMGQLRYLSAMNIASLVIGNSSSGIIEAPSFQVPTINIGDRQKGRVQAQSVINCSPDKESIQKAIETAFSDSFQTHLETVENPYGEGLVSDKIVEVIEEYLKESISIKKSFYDLGESSK